MKSLLIGAALLSQAALFAGVSSSAFAQNYGPASSKYDYYPPGSWRPGQTSVNGYITRSYTGPDGCIYREIYDLTSNGPELVDTIKDWCPPETTPAPVDVTPGPTVNPPPPGGGDPPPAVNPPPVNGAGPKDPPKDDPKPEPVDHPASGFVNPPPAPPAPPAPPSWWERFNKGCREFFECPTEADEKEDHDKALKKAEEERRSQTTQDGQSRTTPSADTTRPQTARVVPADHVTRTDTVRPVTTVRPVKVETPAPTHVASVTHIATPRLNAADTRRVNDAAPRMATHSSAAGFHDGPHMGGAGFASHGGLGIGLAGIGMLLR